MRNASWFSDGVIHACTELLPLSGKLGVQHIQVSHLHYRRVIPPPPPPKPQPSLNVWRSFCQTQKAEQMPKENYFVILFLLAPMNGNMRDVKQASVKQKPLVSIRSRFNSVTAKVDRVDSL